MRQAGPVMLSLFSRQKTEVRTWDSAQVTPVAGQRRLGLRPEAVPVVGLEGAEVEAFRVRPFAGIILILPQAVCL